MSTHVITTDINRDRRDIDVSGKIALLEPSATPLTVILMRARKKKAGSAEVVWFDDDPNVRWTQVNNGAGYASGDTSIVVDAVAHLRVNDLIRVARTGEVLRITAITTGTFTLTVSRSWGSTAAAAMLDDDYLMLTGNAMQEGSLAPDGRKSQPTRVVNYAQIFRTPFSITGTENAEGTKSDEQERARLARKNGILHRIQLESSVLFGERWEDLTGNEPRRAMGGLDMFITNRTSVGGPLIETAFNAILANAFLYGSSKKLLVASHLALSQIDAWAAGRLVVEPKESTYGLAIKNYITSHGELLIVGSRLLVNNYAGYAFVLDMDNIAYRPLRDTVYKRGIQPNDADYLLDEYFTEATLEVRLPATHHILTGITA